MKNLVELIDKYGIVDDSILKIADSAHSAFLKGYNCTQSLLIAFEERLKTPLDEILRLAQPFGGGFSRLREVCGAVSGGTFVMGIIFGSNDPKDYNQKKIVYQRTQTFAKRFEEINGSYICRDLLGLTEKVSCPTPQMRSADYYKKRPCADLVWLAAALVAQIIEE